MSSPFETLRFYVAQGGHVMPPLIGMTLLLWYMVGLRSWTLRSSLIGRATSRGGRVAVRYPSRVTDALDDALFPYYQEVKRGRKTIMAIVVIAPLVGLLGTVSGMIETFDSLGDMSLYSQSGGIAGGISQALFSTQMGLCVAVPGVVVGRLLDRRQHHIEEELDRLKARLAGYP